MPHELPDMSALKLCNDAPKDNKESIQTALEELFLCNFIISLDDYSFDIHKAQPYMTDLLNSCENAIEAVNAYIQYMVADDNKETMRSFLDMTTIQERMQDTNVLDCIYYDPNIGWAKAVFSAVMRDAKGDAQVVALVVEAISKENEISIVDTQTKHSLETESRLWNCIKKLIAANDIPETTNTILRDVMDYYDADRAYIFEFNRKQNTADNTYEVCAPGVEPVIDSLQQMPLDEFDVWIKLFQKNSLIRIRDLNDLIGDESRKDEYNILAPQGISSLIAAPVYFDDRLVGFLGVDNPRRKLDDIAFIKNLAFFCVNVSAREKERAALEEQNLLDPLTGVYNRQGYNEIIRHAMRDQRPLAYAQIDIDNFKNLNDTYGHTFGDEVLKLVAVQLKDAFRSDDYVVRFGGDEFVVFLTNYKYGAWETIGDKLHMIHMQINLVLKKEIDVSLSVGIGWSPNGFTDDLITLADTALYRVKNNGRAGCCIFDHKRHVLYEWKDTVKDNTKGNILEQSNTGACRIELPGGDVSKGRLICNETARLIMGFDASMTPEECLAVWLERVDSYYRETIRKTKSVLLEKGQAECSYLYHHPTMGAIMVRSGGKCIKNKDGVICYGYHQSLQDTRIILREDDSQKLIDAMMGLYFASYYISLTDDRFWIFKSTEESRHLDRQDIPASVNIQNFVQFLVKPAYREKMSRFVDLTTLPERLQDKNFVEAEYESMIADKGWCRIRIFAVNRDEEGTVTHVQLMIASIDKTKRAQLAQEAAMQKALELQLHAGELLAETRVQSVGLIDRESGDTMMYLRGLVSRDAITITFDQMREWGIAHAFPLDAALYDKQFELRYIEAEIQKNGSCTMAFRQMGDQEKCLTLIHHFKVYENDPAKLLLVVENVSDSSPKGIGRIEEFDVLESLAEAVAIFDYETYEIVYANKTARDSLEMDITEIQNRKCYELFCGKNEPCEFCDKIILDQGQHGYMYRTMKATGESNFLHGCAIEVNGRKYRLEQALPEAELKRIAGQGQTVSPDKDRSEG